MNGLNLSRWALQPLAGRLFHAGAGDRRRRVLSAARPQRGSRVHHQDHGHPGQMAGRHHRRQLKAGDRAHRTQGAGDARASITSRATPSPARRRSSSISRASTPPRAVPDAWYQVRKKIDDIRGDSAARRDRAGLRRRVRRHLRHRLRLHRGRLHHRAKCATTSRTCARSCCRCPTSPRSTSSARRTKASTSNTRTAKLAGLGLDPRRADRRAAGAERGHAGRRGSDRRGGDAGARDRRVPVGTRHSRRQFHRRRPADPAWRHRRGQARLRRSAAADLPRQRPAGHRRWRSPCATAATCSNWASNIDAGDGADQADLPIGIEPIWSPTSR